MSPATRKSLALLASTAVAFTGLQVVAPAAYASPAGTDLVISEVYGAGGNSGAVLNRDYVELYNPASVPVDLTGYNLGYWAATGGSGGQAALSGTVPAHGHFLIGEGSGANGAALPAVDFSGNVGMAAAAGRVVLYKAASTTTTIPAPGDPSVVDFVGFGATAATFEGSGPTPAPGTTLSATRKVAGSSYYQDTDDNAADFAAIPPNPQNSSVITGGEEPSELTLATVADQTGVVGTAIAGFSLSASGGTPPYTFAAAGLPAGLALDASSGAVGGTPTTAGTTTVTATVTDGAGATASTQFAFAVDEPAPPACDPAGNVSTTLLINEVYGAGGNSGATLRSDFVELFNPTDAPMCLTGWSIQYRAAASTATPGSSNVTPLAGTVLPHRYFLVKEADGAGGSADLPTPDLVGTVALGGNAGQVFLMSTTTGVAAGNGTTVGLAGVVDMVGYGTVAPAGSAATSYEGTGPAATPLNAQSVSRDAKHTDTNANAVDFTPGEPTPENSATVADHLLVNEVYGGGGNSGAAFQNDFVELYNPTGYPISLLGLSLQYRASATTGAAGNVYALPAQLVAPGDSYLVQCAPGSGNGAPLPPANNATTCGLNLSGTGGQIYLVNGTSGIAAQTNAAKPWTFHPAVVDFVGFGNAAIFEGSGATPAPSNATSVTRSADHLDTGDNAADFTVANPPTPTAGVPLAVPLSIVNPGTRTVDVGATLSPIVLSATSGTPPYTFTVTGLPAGLAFDGVDTISGEPSAAGTSTVHVAVADAAGATASLDFAVVVTSGVQLTPIATIQGTGDRSPYAGTGTSQGTETLTVQGIVTAVYAKGFAANGNATCGFCGFYLQTPGTGGGPDATPGASDAVFVYGGTGFTPAPNLVVGASVQVSGKISEFNGLTELNSTSITVLTTPLAPITPQAAVPAFADREAHEGEAFAPADLVVTDVYNFETYGELGLATGGRPLVQPGEACDVADDACVAAVRQDTQDRGIFFEDGTGTAFLTSGTFYSPQNSNNSNVPLPYVDKTHSARVGAGLTFPAGTWGVLDYRNSKWYLQPQRAVSATGHQTDDATPVAPDLGTDVVTIEDTRPANTAPRDVGGDLRIATYNVENYFTQVGAAFAAANPYYTCQWDYDRKGNPVLVYQCTSPQAIPDQWDPVTGAVTHYTSGTVSAPRGAARQEDLDRQTAKIVAAINGLGADVVSLEELENPNKLREGVTTGPLNPDTGNTKDQGLGTPIAWRDEAIGYLVDELNAAAGAGTWGFVASPEESTDATSAIGMCATTKPNGQPVDGPASTAGTCSWASGQDVIRSGFLYRKATVVPVGPSDLDLPGSSAPTPSPFDNAREPLAQFFKPVGHPNADGFAVIVNHFKSKGDSDSSSGGPAAGDNADNDLTGAFDGDRVRQAEELLRFANEFAAKWDTDRVFLVGDFNAYTGEAPIRTILSDPANTLGFALVTSDDPDDLTYTFTSTVEGVGYGAVGSLDHVFASAAAQAMITGRDVWEINANEPGVYNYSRHDTNATDFWDGTAPFGGSDHNPMVIGIDVPDSGAVRDIQILGSNDFHGRLLGSSSDGGAAQLAGAVNSLKSTWGANDSVFVAAGDLIGASTFESSIQKDRPTLEALSAAGLEVSAVGNHEFDQGYQDLIDRVMRPYDPVTNPYGAAGGLSWQYIGANVVYRDTGDPIVPATWIKDFGGGIRVGFVGAVTEDLMSLVAPSGMAGVEVTSVVDSANRYAADLKGAGVDLVVLLLHEGAPSTDCTTMTTNDSAFKDVLGGISPDIDAVISGHTHLEYSCSFPVPQWAGRAITQRPVVSAGQYGIALDQLVYSFDAAGNPVAVVSNTIGVKGPGSTLFSFPEDPAVKAIVDTAVADAVGPGSQVLGRIAGPFGRARLADGTENRGGESTLGNLVAEIQRWATGLNEDVGEADLALMNPGGLRTDLLGTANGDGSYDVTYRQAADVQPFANTLVNMRLTGAQLRAVLEEQWQRDANGNVPARPFLKLGTSQGFSYTYDETADPAHAGATLGHVTGMWLDGVPMSDTATYSVTVNSFLAGGGDNFWLLAGGTDKRDTGLTDLQAQVDYMAAFAADEPLPVDYAQHAVSVTFPPDAPAGYGAGDQVAFALGSLAMTAPGDATDDAVEVRLGTAVLGTAAVANDHGTGPYDTSGTASVAVTLPATIPAGAQLTVVGETTGTVVRIPVTLVSTALVIPATTSADIPLGAGSVHVAAGPQDVTVTEGAEPGTVQVAVPAGGTAVATFPGGYDEATVTLGAGTYLLGDPTLAVLDGEATVTAPVGGHQVVIVLATGASLTWGADGSTIEIVSGSGPVTAGTCAVTAGTIRAFGNGGVLLDADTDCVVVPPAAAATTTTGADVSFVLGSGPTVTLTATVTSDFGTPTGAVTFADGARVLGTVDLVGGVAALRIPAQPLAAGTHVVTVAYGGSAEFLGSSDTFTLAVTWATATFASPGVVGYGLPGVLWVTVTGPWGSPLTGTVTVAEAGATVARVPVPLGARPGIPFAVPIGATALTPGTHPVTVTYGGNAQLAGSSATTTVVVAKAAAFVSVPWVTQRYGSAATVTVRVLSGVAATGTVTLTAGTTSLGTATVTNGVATFTIPAKKLPRGTLTPLVAVYSGSAFVAPAVGVGAIGVL